MLSFEGIDLIMNINSIDKIICIRMYITLILKAGENEKNYCRKNSHTFKYMKISFKTIKNPKVQFKYLQVHWKNIIILIYFLKPMPTIVKKECVQKKMILFHNFIYLYFLFGEPQFLYNKVIFWVIYHAFTHGM
jgi:hypothetical protein